MEHIFIDAPPYPFFVYSGDAMYRPGDLHRKRSALGCFDILFVEYGCLFMIENGNKYDVRQNDVLVLHPEYTHRSYKGCEEKTYFHWLHFFTTERISVGISGAHDRESSRTLSYPKFQQETLVLPVSQSLDKTKAPTIFNTLKSLESLAINRYHQSAMINKTELAIGSRLHQQQLFLSVFSNLCIDNDSTSSNRIASAIMHYIHTNYSQNITLKDMAASANCHPTHVIRCFSKEYHITPGKALLNIRLEQAQRLLINTDFSCERIADQTGFSSASYFSKIFKEHVHVSPQTYRKENTGMRERLERT